MLSAIRTHLSAATPIQRVIFGIFLNTPFLIAFMAAQSVGLFVEEWRQLMNPFYMILGNYVLGGALLIQVVMVWRLWPRRHSPKEIPKTSTFFAILVATALSYEAFMAGNLTFSTNLVIITIVPIGLLLLDLRSVGIALCVGIFYITMNDILIHSEIIPYAPVYSPNAFANGKHHIMAEALRTGVMYVSVVAYGLMIAVLAHHYDFQRNTLIQSSRTDSLTGLSNRRYFMQRLQEECSRQMRTQQPLCLAMIDADHFKKINDTFGHVMGDEVLRSITNTLTEHMRVPEDLPARLGGEEFAIVFTDTELDGAKKVCQRIQESLKQMAFVSGGNRFYVTLSIGLVESHGLDGETLLRLADANMYKAKASGRNTLISSQEAMGGGHEKLASMA